MIRGLSLTGAALVAALAFSAPARAVDTMTGVGPAATANQPSTVGLGVTEGRSYWRHRYGWHRGWHRGGWHRGWHRRHWRRW